MTKEGYDCSSLIKMMGWKNLSFSKHLNKTMHGHQVNKSDCSCTLCSLILQRRKAKVEGHGRASLPVVATHNGHFHILASSDSSISPRLIHQKKPWCGHALWSCKLWSNLRVGFLWEIKERSIYTVNMDKILYMQRMETSNLYMQRQEKKSKKSTRKQWEERDLYWTEETQELDSIWWNAAIILLSSIPNFNQKFVTNKLTTQPSRTNADRTRKYYLKADHIQEVMSEKFSR